MQLYQQSIKNNTELGTLSIDFVPTLFILFMSPTYIGKEDFVEILNDKYPDTTIIGCSTAGEIIGNVVSDASVALTAIRFEKSKIKLSTIDLIDVDGDSLKAGAKISSELKSDDLRHILVLSDGLNVNGAELVKGLHTDLSKDVSITGGLAGDCSNFNETFIITNKEIASNKILGLGLYGDDLKIGFGSQGGWDSFGVERLVTKSEGNVLYELDGQPALDLYKSFLGEKAKDLPSSGLLFPLSMRNDDNMTPVVRTILGVNEEDQSLTFAGNIFQGSYVRLMKANIDRLINGAEESAKISKEIIGTECQLAILVSCVGRRLVLKQLVEEEVEVVNEYLGSNVMSTGFYSYGEIAPFNKFTPCALHNQTMTITTFAE